MSENQNLENKREQDKLEVKQIAKKYAVIGICKWTAILLILVVFALPLIKIDLFFTEKNVSMFDLVLADSEAEEIEELILLEIMADFAGGDSDKYENLFSLMYCRVNNFPDNIPDML